MSRTVGFDGIGMGSYLTFSQGATGFTKGTHENWPCKMSANGAVSRAASTDIFFGIVRNIDPHGDVVSVQDDGFATLPYTSTAPTVGYVVLKADGSGGVAVDSSPSVGDMFYLVVSVDTSAATVTFDLD